MAVFGVLLVANPTRTRSAEGFTAGRDTRAQMALANPPVARGSAALDPTTTDRHADAANPCKAAGFCPLDSPLAGLDSSRRREDAGHGRILASRTGSSNQHRGNGGIARP